MYYSYGDLPRIGEKKRKNSVSIYDRNDLFKEERQDFKTFYMKKVGIMLFNLDFSITICIIGICLTCPHRLEA